MDLQSETPGLAGRDGLGIQKVPMPRDNRNDNDNEGLRFIILGDAVSRIVTRLAAVRRVAQ